MATENFKVEKSEAWKALPVGSIRFTQNNHVEAFLGEAAAVGELTGVSGESIYAGVPYTLDEAKQYFVRTVRATAKFGVVVG